ncbi:hypothetical protein C8R46DRAFT_1320341 [Mycena filopes]|nr:hypothetical protein C8R46DRAFT_1320341 [Mycena filopes]
MLSTLESDTDELRVAEAQQDDSEQDRIPYPVLTLPTEIISEIFIRFLPPYPECPPWTGCLSPSVLTQICGKWREIALSTPELWGAAAFNLDIPPDPRLRLGVAHRAQIDSFRGQAWLDRSRACPLSLQIVSLRYQDQRVLQTLDALLPHNVNSGIIDLGTPNSSQVSIFHDAPLLRTVVLNYAAITALVLPWAQLTKLVLHHVFPSDCSLVLQQTSNLVHCEIPFLCLDIDDDSVEPVVHLPHLESLVFGDESDIITTYHGTFIVPALRRLQIPRYFLGSDCIDSLRGFIAKSGCQLCEVLITGRLDLGVDEYHAAFPSIPSLSFDEVETSKEFP